MNNNYLIFISPEDASLIMDILLKSAWHDGSEELIQRFKKQIKLNEILEVENPTVNS